MRIIVICYVQGVVLHKCMVVHHVLLWHEWKRVGALYGILSSSSQYVYQFNKLRPMKLDLQFFAQNSGKMMQAGGYYSLFITAENC